MGPAGTQAPPAETSLASLASPASGGICLSTEGRSHWRTGKNRKGEETKPPEKRGTCMGKQPPSFPWQQPPDPRRPSVLPQPWMVVTTALFTGRHSPLCASLGINLIPYAVTAGTGLPSSIAVICHILCVPLPSCGHGVRRGWQEPEEPGGVLSH